MSVTQNYNVAIEALTPADRDAFIEQGTLTENVQALCRALWRLKLEPYEELARDPDSPPKPAIGKFTGRVSAEHTPQVYNKADEDAFLATYAEQIAASGIEKRTAEWQSITIPREEKKPRTPLDHAAPRPESTEGTGTGSPG